MTEQNKSHNALEEVKVNCSTCKALCCRLEVLLIDDNDEQVPAEFVINPSFGFSSMKRSDDGWCEALDRYTMKCTIYELRPFLCREYQVGDFDCLLERKKLACTF